MFGPKTDLTVLAARKNLLLAESELNRLRWQQEWGAFQDGAQGLARRAVSTAAVVSSAAIALAGVAALRGGRAPRSGGGGSWLAKLVRLARLGTSLWLAYQQSRSR